MPAALTDYIVGRQEYDYADHGRTGNVHTEFVPDEIVERVDLAIYLMHDQEIETLNAYGMTDFGDAPPPLNRPAPGTGSPGRVNSPTMVKRIPVHGSSLRLAPSPCSTPSSNARIAWRYAKMYPDLAGPRLDLTGPGPEPPPCLTGFACDGLGKDPPPSHREAHRQSRDLSPVVSAGRPARRRELERGREIESLRGSQPPRSIRPAWRRPFGLTQAPARTLRRIPGAVT